jgi:WD40 repeat protein
VTAAAAFGGSGEDVVAFGSGAKVTLATVNGTSLKVLTEISDNRGDILVLAFSKDGNLLASGDVSPDSYSPANEQSTGRIVLIDVTKKETLVSSKWTNHTGRITSLAFSENGERIVSGGLDEAIYVWHVKKTLKNIPIKVSLLSERVWRLISRTLILVVLVVYLGLGVMRRLSVLVQMGV